jgi:hypothetical protein
MTYALPLSSRIYGRLLDLYPEDLRRDHGAEMALVFAEDLDTARREAGGRGAIRVWRCALHEFIRFAMPRHASSPAVRVPAISFGLCVAMMSAEMELALRHAPNPPTLFNAVRATLLLPLFATPIISLVSVWACRGSGVMSLGLSHSRREEA